MQGNRSDVYQARGGGRPLPPANSWPGPTAVEPEEEEECYDDLEATLEDLRQGLTAMMEIMQRMASDAAETKMAVLQFINGAANQQYCAPNGPPH